MGKISIIFLVLLSVLFFGCQHSPTGEKIGRVTEWGPNYYEFKETPKTPPEILDISGLETLWGENFDNSAPNWNGYGPNQNHAIIHFEEIPYAISLPQYPPTMKGTDSWFDIYIRNPDTYDYEDNVMLTFFYDEEGYLRSLAMNGAKFTGRYTKQLFVKGKSEQAAKISAREMANEMRRIIKDDSRSYWGTMPPMMEKFILAIDNHIKL